MTAIKVYNPSGSSNELQFVNSSGEFDASLCTWDSDNNRFGVNEISLENITHTLTVNGNTKIIGNLDIIGTQSIIETQNLQIKDTIIGLGSGSAGEATAGDRGFLFLIGAESNPAFYWDESESEFRLSRITNTPGDLAFNDPDALGQSGFANLRVNDLILNSCTIAGDLSIDNNTYFSGSVSDFTATGSIRAQAGLSGSLTRLTDGTSYLVAGNRINIVSQSNGQIEIIYNDNISNKSVYEVTASHSQASGLFLPGVDFSLVSYRPKGIDVYVNGQLMMSGSLADYTTLADYTIGSAKNELKFSFDLIEADYITVRMY